MKTEINFENISFFINEETGGLHIFTAIKDCFKYMKEKGIYYPIYSVTDKEFGSLSIIYSEKGLLIDAENILRLGLNTIFSRIFHKKRFKILGKIIRVITFKERYSIFIHH